MKYRIVSKRNTLQTITVTNSSNMEYVATLFPGENLVSYNETSSMRRKKLAGEINYFIIKAQVDEAKPIPIAEDTKQENFEIKESAVVSKQSPRKRRSSPKKVEEVKESSEKVEDSAKEEENKNK